ncbi:MAG: helix-turn-helix domain-containing protein [Bacteroidia bacterium]|nr:helix-turn-helix domain-containing protein [Bacteroidia bacterium]
MKKNIKLTPEEEAEAFVYPSTLSKEEKQAANKELLEHRFKMLAEMSEEEKQHWDLVGLKFRLKKYLDNPGFDKNRSFGQFVEEYIRILNLKRKDFAKEIDVHETRLSRIINNKEEPNKQIFYRLEKHSEYIIPAQDWWMVCEKAVEYEIRTDKATRKKEYAHVKKKRKPKK